MWRGVSIRFKTTAASFTFLHCCFFLPSLVNWGALGCSHIKPVPNPAMNMFHVAVVSIGHRCTIPRRFHTGPPTPPEGVSQPPSERPHPLHRWLEPVTEQTDIADLGCDQSERKKSQRQVHTHGIGYPNTWVHTFLGHGWQHRGRLAIISWYENSSLSVHWITPSKTRTFPYVLLETHTGTKIGRNVSVAGTWNYWKMSAWRDCREDPSHPKRSDSQAQLVMPATLPMLS